MIEIWGFQRRLIKAYRKAKGDWILLCNSDITFSPNAHSLLSYGISHPDEMVTVEMVSEDGTLQRVIHKRFPTIAGVFFDFGSIGSYLTRKS